MKKPILVERFSDNGEHAHWELIDAETHTVLQSGHSYFAKHLPTGEDWYILGIDCKGDRVCVAGWPASKGKLSDCRNLKVNEPLTEEEITYRKRKFGENWL